MWAALYCFQLQRHRQYDATHYDHKLRHVFTHTHVKGTQVINAMDVWCTSIPQLAHMYSIQHENWAISTSSLVATAAATAAYVHDPIHESCLGFRPIGFAGNPITWSSLAPRRRAITLKAGTATQDGCKNLRWNCVV